MGKNILRIFGLSLLTFVIALTSCGGGGGSSSGGPTTTTPVTEFAYVANVSSNDISVYTINQTTGTLTAVGTPVTAGTGPFSIITSKLK